ncbi:hypothetical protein [Hymenobacter cavernae]|uniref:Nuclear transport factor 2 family protein n=1 Tax=Hymenobacter cavernae TaxID=2044852 RepID=A0ABQ1U555_9BACT|nr:hypothetical protein [Hymenobacter cavernae]GGF09368.1 hypothetical protein GCM10011383_20720 [Hymenobacter cavernae]
MIQSKLVADILNLLLDGDELLLQNQVQFLTDTEYNYTGVGLIVQFSHSSLIHNFKLADGANIFDGVEIRSPELAIGANATLIIREGIIDHLDIWSFDGNYPQKELTKYVLTQKWDGSPRRQITRN